MAEGDLGWEAVCVGSMVGVSVVIVVTRDYVGARAYVVDCCNDAFVLPVGFELAMVQGRG